MSVVAEEAPPWDHSVKNIYCVSHSSPNPDTFSTLENGLMLVGSYKFYF